MVRKSKTAQNETPKAAKAKTPAAAAPPAPAPAPTPAPAAPVAAPASSGFNFLGVSKVDEELDGVFSKSAAFAIPTPIVSAPVRIAPPPASLPTPASIASASTPAPSTSDSSKKRKRAAAEAVPEPAAAPAKESKKSKKAKVAEVEQVVEEAADEVDEEEQEEVEDGKEEESGEEDNELTHESKKSGKKDKGKKKEKYVPEGESAEERDKRTIFVGGVDVECMKNKSKNREFRRHILSFAPTASIESIRFRSIAFATPTAELPDETATPEENAEKQEARRVQREKERTAKWREEQDKEENKAAKARGGRRKDDDDEEEAKKDVKVFQEPAEKRKVAFIKKQFHAEVGTVNAYIVFAHNPPNRSANVPPILNPYEAVSLVIANGHNSTFLGHTLRIDASKRSVADMEAAAKEEGKSTLPAKRAAWAAGKDVKASLFVGNLDFATKDEDLRQFFEGLVTTERGVPEGGPWVVDVRIIRDKDTQLGKGFGYVNFKDRESVDEILALPSNKLKFAKRNLRVQASKALPTSLGGQKDKVVAPAKPIKGAAPAKAFGKKAAAPVAKAVKPVFVGQLPKGNPLLGEKIKDMSKDERKAVKATDADRLARRAAKKQSAKVKADAANRREKVKLDVRGTAKKGAPKVAAKKSRVRSGNALKKMKGRAD